jgi:hypothetical protein
VTTRNTWGATNLVTVALVGIVTVALGGCGSSQARAARTPSSRPPTSSSSLPPPVPAPVATTPATSSTTARAAATSVTAIGDSVMIDAQPSLRAAIPGIDIDAAVSRQVSAGITEIRGRAASGRLGDTVVFALGTNGPFTAAEFQQLVSATGGRQLVVLTSHCPYCSWTRANNAMVQASCAADSRCVVADWEALAERNPRWFTGDGVHMPIGGIGAQSYAALVAMLL